MTAFSRVIIYTEQTFLSFFLRKVCFFLSLLSSSADFSVSGTKMRLSAMIRLYSSVLLYIFMFQTHTCV